LTFLMPARFDRQLPLRALSHHAALSPPSSLLSSLQVDFATRFAGRVSTVQRDGTLVGARGAAPRSLRHVSPESRSAVTMARRSPPSSPSQSPSRSARVVAFGDDQFSSSASRSSAAAAASSSRRAAAAKASTAARRVAGGPSAAAASAAASAAAAPRQAASKSSKPTFADLQRVVEESVVPGGSSSSGAPSRSERAAVAAAAAVVHDTKAWGWSELAADDDGGGGEEAGVAGALVEAMFSSRRERDEELRAAHEIASPGRYTQASSTSPDRHHRHHPESESESPQRWREQQWQRSASPPARAVRPAYGRSESPRSHSNAEAFDELMSAGPAPADISPRRAAPRPKGVDISPRRVAPRGMQVPRGGMMRFPAHPVVEQSLSPAERWQPQIQIQAPPQPEIIQQPQVVAQPRQRQRQRQVAQRQVRRARVPTQSDVAVKGHRQAQTGQRSGGAGPGGRRSGGGGGYARSSGNGNGTGGYAARGTRGRAGKGAAPKLREMSYLKDLRREVSEDKLKGRNEGLGEQSEQDKLYYSRQARPVVYEPKTLREWKNKGKQCQELGRLGADLGDPILVAKRANQMRVKEFAKKLNRVNKTVLKQEKSAAAARPRRRREPAAKSSREKVRTYHQIRATAAHLPLTLSLSLSLSAQALDFAKNVPKPRVKAARGAPQRQRGASKTANQRSNEKAQREQREFDSLLGKHEADRQQIAAIRREVMGGR